MQCFSSTRNIASASAFYTFENPQVRRSAFYRRPPRVGNPRVGGRMQIANNYIFSNTHWLNMCA